MAAPIAIRPAIGRLLNTARNTSVPGPHFLPVVQTSCSQSRPFSSTPERSMRRPRRDNNRLRGLSSIYRSGPRFRMNIDKSELPIPAHFKPEIKVDPDHGLWQFFYAKDKLVLTPDEVVEHGRAWSVEELRHKSWDDLHKLWWVCVKEQNRIATARKEATRMRLNDGQEEIAYRLGEVRKTMQAIKHALTERFYLWEDARKLAETDDEIDLANTKQPYTPRTYIEEDAALEAEAEAEATETTPAEGEVVAPEKGDAVASEKGEAEKLEEAPSTLHPESVGPSTLPSKATEAKQPSTRP
ncbi:mitochondrial 39-S ribosomal protein L47 (MRP-L47)-domain-containing protein [Biscogniauxia marginata]|nr:mitochondrial 39-S ribosomal protein L47 (MRP-L47)-domain-containing protein [Biscogniauxia marginata]